MKKISLEVAKLLGVPFGWRGFRPHRFVHTKEGLKLQLFFPPEWHDSELTLSMREDPPFLIEEGDLATWANCSKTRKELEDESDSTAE